MIEIILAAATLFGGVTAIWFLYEKVSGFGRRKKVVFPETRDDFYEYYSNCLGKAKVEIWITSDGFNLRNSRSKIFSEVMTKSTEQAMKNGAVVNRVQIIETMHLNWIAELKRLLIKYPDKFLVYINRTMPNIPNVCSIDPDDKHCISERMEHELGAVTQGSKAKTFSFSHGYPKQAHQTREMVRQIIEHPNTVKITEDNIDEFEKTLFEERIEKLEAWALGNRDSDDLSGSGVFDERVISAVLARKMRT